LLAKEGLKLSLTFDQIAHLSCKYNDSSKACSSGYAHP